MLITDLIPLGLLAFAASALQLLLFHRKLLRKDFKSALRLFCLRFLGLWWAFTAMALLFKLRIVLHNEPGSPFAAVNLIPFKSIAQCFALRDIVQLGGNLLVFVPFPLLLQLNFPQIKTRTLWLAVLCSVLLIEPLQLLVNVLLRAPANVIDIDDCILNAAGCLLGLCGAMLLRHIAKQRAAAKSACLTQI